MRPDTTGFWEFTQTVGQVEDLEVLFVEHAARGLEGLAAAAILLRLEYLEALGRRGAALRLLREALKLQPVDPRSRAAQERGARIGAYFRRATLGLNNMPAPSAGYRRTLMWLSDEHRGRFNRFLRDVLRDG